MALATPYLPSAIMERRWRRAPEKINVSYHVAANRIFTSNEKVAHWERLRGETERGRATEGKDVESGIKNVERREVMRQMTDKSHALKNKKRKEKEEVKVNSLHPKPLFTLVRFLCVSIYYLCVCLKL